MAGVQLRTCFAFLTKIQKHEIRQLCEKYNVKPQCSFSGGEKENMTFDFGDDAQSKNEFLEKMEIIMDVSANKDRRRVIGYKVECPL
ncbi:MAG: hypothetical protein KAJ93_05000 [Methanosarcinales archaeon]|nr:hypothetical protein [Methanosarcinales archaeon]